MADRVPPHALEAERCVLGAMLLNRDAIADASRILRAEDFFNPHHGELFAVMLDLWRDGRDVDVRTVVDHDPGAVKRVGGNAELLSLQTGTPSSRNVGTYARTVAEAAAHRQLIGVAAEIAELGYNRNPEGLDRARAMLADVSGPAAALPADLWDFTDWFDRPTPARAPWVVPGLLRRLWRVVLVAPEGVGKSTVMRSFALMAAQGVHPFTHREIRPVRTLLVDVENPEEAIEETGKPMADGLEPGRAFLWHRQGRINLRARADRAEFESVLAHLRPDLVCMGPVRKLYSRQPGENYEQAADRTQEVIDDFRQRYGFALLLEAHAPHGESAGRRVLRPEGSVFWLGWPELGFGLAPERGGRLRRDLFRHDRVKHAWPDFLDRSTPWPWAGVWTEGMPRAEEAS